MTTTTKPTPTKPRKAPAAKSPAKEATTVTARVVQSAPCSIPMHPRANLVPALLKATQYVHRTHNGVEDFAILDEAFETRHNVIFYGPTGASKTSVIYAYCAARGLPLVNLGCNGSADPNVIFGGLRPHRDGGFVTRPTDLYYVLRYGGCVNLDELNALPARIGVIFHAPLDGRRIITIDQYDGSEDLDELGNLIVPTFPIHPSTIFTASFNPGYHGMVPINEATFNRFAIKLPWSYSEEVEQRLVLSQRLIDFAAGLRKQGEAGTIVTPVPTNALCELEQFAQTLGLKFAAENFLSAFSVSEQEGVRRALTLQLRVIAEEIDEQVGGTAVLDGYMRSLGTPITNADND